MLWLVLAVLWLILFPVVGIGLSFIGGPFWWLLVAAFLGWQVLEDFGATNAAANESDTWKVILLIVLAAVTVLGGLYIVLNAKIWNAASRAIRAGGLLSVLA